MVLLSMILTTVAHIFWGKNSHRSNSALLKAHFRPVRSYGDMRRGSKRRLQPMTTPASILASPAAPTQPLSLSLSLSLSLTLSHTYTRTQIRQTYLTDLARLQQQLTTPHHTSAHLTHLASPYAPHTLTPLHLHLRTNTYSNRPWRLLAKPSDQALPASDQALRWTIVSNYQHCGPIVLMGYSITSCSVWGFMVMWSPETQKRSNVYHQKSQYLGPDTKSRPWSRVAPLIAILPPWRWKANGGHHALH